jgi:hypothetical protein
MAMKVRVFRNNPGKPDHGAPVTAFAVDAVEMCRPNPKGVHEYVRSMPRGAVAAPLPPAAPPVEEDSFAFVPAPAPETEPVDETHTPDGFEKVEDPAPAGVDPTYDSLKRDQLLELASLADIAGRQTMNKTALIQAILAAESRADVKRKIEGWFSNLPTS